MADGRTLADRRWIGQAAALALAALVVALAVLQVRGWDGTVNADGISYLDLARRYAAGDAGAIANGYWSPLYPMLLGAALALSPTSEMATVLAVNVAIFAAAALALVRLARALGDAPAEAGPSRAVRVARAFAAGALAVWCLLRMITATNVTPDALLAVWLFLAAAELADVALRPDAPRHDRRFGLVLAVGYWTKAVFLPVAFVALAAYLLAARAPARRRATTHALLPFFLVAAPLVAVQSYSQGRPSFGETGRLNYGWYVHGAPHAAPVSETIADTRARVTRGEPAPVALAAAPGAVLFTAATSGTFPYWLDAARYEPRSGAPFSAEAQWRILAFNAHWFRVTGGAFALFAAIALAAALSRAPARWRRLLVALPAVTMLALYALTHPEGRMGAASIVSVLLVAMTLADVGPAGRRRAAIAVECVALAILGILALGRTAKRIPVGPVARAATPSVASLRAAGLDRGAAIALVGSPYGQLWAHEGEVRIVAVIPAPDSARLGERTLRAALAEAAARGVPLGAVVGSGDVVASPDAQTLAPGWWVLR